MARFFFALSRILFALMLVMAVLSPASAQENQPETTCVEEDDLLRCTVWVNEFDNGPMFALEITEDQTPINAITFTSMTCDDWDNAPHAYAADPHIWLYSVDSEGVLTLVADDDDSAPHNDGSNMCWDSQLTPTLDIGSYQLKADAFDTDYIGTYTMELSGGVWSLINNSEPAPDPQPTPTPDDSVPDEEVEPTPEPVEPAPQPDPTPEETPTPEEEVEPPIDEPIQDPTPLPEEPEEEQQLDPPLEPPTVQPSPPPAPAPPSLIVETPPPPVTIDIEELEELPLEDDIMWNLDDVEWEEFDFDELPEIEFVAEEIETEEEEETTFFDDGEQAQPSEVQSDVELEEDTLELEEDIEFVLEEYEDIEEIDFEELDADELDDEILTEILQDEETVEVFLEEVLEDNPDFFEDATEDQVTVIFEAAPEIFNEASDEVKEELEEEINVFAGGFEEYVPEDSTISVDDRRSIIAVTTATTIVAGAAIARPAPPPPTPRPVQPAPTRPSSPQSASPSGPETPRRKTRDDKA